MSNSAEALIYLGIDTGLLFGIWVSLVCIIWLLGRRR